MCVRGDWTTYYLQHVYLQGWRIVSLWNSSRISIVSEIAVLQCKPNHHMVLHFYVVIWLCPMAIRYSLVNTIFEYRLKGT